MSDRVVVTGIGCLASIGAGLEDFDKALFEGACGLASGNLADTADADFPAHEIAGFRPQEWLGPKGIRVLDRSARLLCVAAHMALRKAGLLAEEGGCTDPSIGLVCGTMFGSVHSIASFDWSGLEDGVKYVNPMLFPNTVINSPAGQVAIKFGLQGVNSTIATGFTSGLYALHYAAEFLRLGRASALLAGGVEELCQESYLGMLKNGYLSSKAKLEPFGPDRDGTIPGEGAALWLVENESRALSRGLKPLAEICGFGCAHDADSIDAYQVRAHGAISAMTEALKSAGVEPQDVGLIVANANGSRTGDKMEAVALRKVFGSGLERIPVCAPKASFGEAMGASGALSATVACLALQRGEVPPTFGFTIADDALRLSPECQPIRGRYALVNSFGCDGNNAVLALKAC